MLSDWRRNSEGGQHGLRLSFIIHRRQQQRWQALWDSGPYGIPDMCIDLSMNRCVGPLSNVLEPGFGRRRRLEFVSALRYVYDMLKGEGASSAGYIQERGMLGTASAKAIRHNYCLRVSFSMARIRDYMLPGEWSGFVGCGSSVGASYC